jgi:glycosyltransferase involved in cell wall biosynthesis
MSTIIPRDVACSEGRTILPLRICMIGTWPAIDVLDPALVKPRYHVRKKAHPASWMRALALGLVARDDVESVTVFVDSREVRRVCKVVDGKLNLVFLAKGEPGQTDPFHLHIPARIRLRPWLRKLNPDIVHGFGTESASGWLAAHSGFPNVVLIQGIMGKLLQYAGGSLLRNSMRRWMEKRTVCKADGLIAENEWVGQWALEHRSADDVRIIPNPVSPEFINAMSDYARPLCVCIGALSRIKNPFMVIRAFAQAANPDAQLVMVGAGPLRKRCEDLVQTCGISRQTLFAGRLPRDSIIGYLQHARCLAIGSRVDSSPNVVIEALAMGVPVVGANGGGIPNLVRHGEEGFIVAQDDDAAMGRHIRQFLEDPLFCAQLGGKALQRVRHEHSATAVSASHVTWYREIIARRTADG